MQEGKRILGEVFCLRAGRKLSGSKGLLSAEVSFWEIPVEVVLDGVTDGSHAYWPRKRGGEACFAVDSDGQKRYFTRLSQRFGFS